MAEINETNISAGESISANSYDTALCVIPPHAQCNHIEQLRELYDKAHGSWPAHVNLIYPYVAPESLPRAQERIQSVLDAQLTSSSSLTVELGEAGYFDHRNNSNVHICESQSDTGSTLTHLRDLALQALGLPKTTSKLHLTIGQSTDNTASARDFLVAKAGLLPTLNFQPGALAILIRERTPGAESSSRMRLWGTIKLPHSSDSWIPQKPEHWLTSSTNTTQTGEPEDEEDDSDIDAREGKVFCREVQKGTTFKFDFDEEKWAACDGTAVNDGEASNLSISTYNVLIDSEYPPARDRDPLLVQNILADPAMADILVLQEVSDDFLSYLLSDSEVQRRYPYASHGPPDQSEIGPLPSLRNIVLLSTFSFSWNLVPFQRRHKSALVARFPGILATNLSGQTDMVVAGVHLTCGLTDGSVAAKKVQLTNLINYLNRNHSTEPWVVAGDFNMTTSTHTIDNAIKSKSISSQTAAVLSATETMMDEARLVDVWSTVHLEQFDDFQENSDDLFEGEHGATFDPRNNVLAAATSGTSQNRPQRYDRILVRSRRALDISGFNLFGKPEEFDGKQIVASDHYGIRANLRIFEVAEITSRTAPDALGKRAVSKVSASSTLSDQVEMNSALTAHGMIPTDEEYAHRQEAFELLRSILGATSEDEDPAISDIPLVLVTVGSQAIGVWTSGSDIDCLCIGSISSKTFFKLARQRLMRTEDDSVRIVRKVEAHTGTMLELSIKGVPMDLQYCPAGRVMENWSTYLFSDPSHDAFNLSMLSLRKLKPYRDLLEMRPTCLQPSFQQAYRLLKLWALQRGLYSARFGYLSGIQITLMLVWVATSGITEPEDLVLSFFKYYANFDWENDMVYDASFFGNTKPRYQRSAREPMVILGYHVPNSNIARTSTVPGLQTLVKEFKAAEHRLSEPGMTWQKFFDPAHDGSEQSGVHHGENAFLRAHSNFVKVDIQFWGRTLAKGKSLVGWVESRCLSLVVDIHKVLPNLEVRIWPARFTDNDTTNASATQDYHGCYLIGLSDMSNAATSQDDRKNARAKLEKVLDRFLSQLKTDEKNYDPSISWLGASLIRPADVRNLALDTREWGDYTPDLEPDSDEEDELEDEDLDSDPTPLKRTLPQRPKPTATPVSASKLRPASDVLNRLRWDPSLDPADYIIGYEDRFLGAKETGLERWKTEQTDEEFIPQHRILYFKKKSGDIVWERMTRIDRVFGSGLGDGGA